jgi:hypothetical protein
MVFPPPFFDKHLGLFQSIENLSIEQLVSELAAETLKITLLPRADRLDEECLCPEPFEPLANHLSRKLGPVVRADIAVAFGVMGRFLSSFISVLGALSLGDSFLAPLGQLAFPGATPDFPSVTTLCRHPRGVVGSPEELILTY